MPGPIDPLSTTTLIQPISGGTEKKNNFASEVKSIRNIPIELLSNECHNIKNPNYLKSKDCHLKNSTSALNNTSGSVEHKTQSYCFSEIFEAIKGADTGEVLLEQINNAKHVVGESHKSALIVLDGFVQSYKGKKLDGFPNIDPLTIAREATLRLLDPSVVAQKNTETCGPSAFVIDLCRNNPRGYVTSLVELATSGKSKLGELELTPNKHVRQMTANKLPMGQADWVMVGSVRNSESSTKIDSLMGLFKDKENFGITPGTLFNWLNKSGYESVTMIGPKGYTDSLTGQFQKKQVGDDSMNVKSLPVNGMGAAKLAEMGTKQGCSTFLFVDDKLSNALSNGTPDFQIRSKLGRDGKNPELYMTSPQEDINNKKGRHALKGEQQGGHVMLITDLEIGGHTVSLTALNRGSMVSHHTLPKDDFIACVRGAMVATGLQPQIR